jgi:hypothetical protein
MRYWLLFAPLLSNCVPTPCNNSCIDGVGVIAHLAVSADGLSGTAVTLCLNSMCSQGAFGSASNSDQTSTELDGSFHAIASLIPDATGSGVTVDSYLRSAETFKDGDVYELTIVDPDGATLFSNSGTADYTMVDTCGTDCIQLQLDLTEG